MFTCDTFCIYARECENAVEMPPLCRLRVWLDFLHVTLQLVKVPVPSGKKLSPCGKVNKSISEFRRRQEAAPLVGSNPLTATQARCQWPSWKSKQLLVTGPKPKSFNDVMRQHMRIEISTQGPPPNTIPTLHNAHVFRRKP